MFLNPNEKVITEWKHLEKTVAVLLLLINVGEELTCSRLLNNKVESSYRTLRCCSVQFSSVQLLSCVLLFPTPWNTAHQASLSITNSQSSFKLMSIESLMPSSISSSVIPFSSCPQSLWASASFPMSQLFASGGQSIGLSASASVLPVNTLDWSPLGWTRWISLQSKDLSFLNVEF